MTHSESFKSMRQCGLLSRNVIRQIQSDIVTVEALSRLQNSEITSNVLENSGMINANEESKREMDLYYNE